MSLTKSSIHILGDRHALLQWIFMTFATKFNWAYNDGYGENQIGQLGYGFSFILLSKYGAEKRLDSFYAERYFKAFPSLLESIEQGYGTLGKYWNHCYSVRTFDRFLDYFGLINLEVERNRLDSIKTISKTELFDRLIKCAPHNTPS